MWQSILIILLLIAFLVVIAMIDFTWYAVLIAGGLIALVLMLFLLPEIKRYIEIKSM